MNTSIDGNVMERAAATAPHHAHETQPYSDRVKRPIALAEAASEQSIEHLNQLLADSFTLRDLYKKHHWQAAGPTFYQLHLLFDKHAAEQSGLVDAIAERIQMLGGVSLAMAPDVAEATLIPRAPKGREDTASQVARLLQAHEIVLKESHLIARQAAEAGDAGTSDLIVSGVIRTGEAQVWFLAVHVFEPPVGPPLRSHQ